MKRVVVMIIVLTYVIMSYGQNESQWVIPEYGDTIQVMFSSGTEIHTDTNYVRQFEKGKNALWDLSEFFFREKPTGYLAFDSVPKSDIEYNEANYKICYVNNSGGGKGNEVNYWAINETSWYFLSRYRYSIMDCSVNGWEQSRVFEQPHFRFSLPIKPKGSWDYNTSYIDVNLNNNAPPSLVQCGLSGVAEILGTGTLKTRYGDYKNCVLIQESYNQALESKGIHSTAKYSRWTWISPEIKWPIVIYNEWAVERKADTSVYVASDYMVQTKSYETLLQNNSLPIPEISFYPNPTSGIINLNQSVVGTVVVQNITGEIVLKSELNNVHFFDLSELSSGVYYLNLETNQSSARVHKLVKWDP